MDPAPLAPTSLSVKKGLEEVISSGRNRIFLQGLPLNHSLQCSLEVLPAQILLQTFGTEFKSFPNSPSPFRQEIHRQVQKCYPQSLNVRNRTMPVHNSTDATQTTPAFTINKTQ